jgi:ribonucleoside-diphosphate reductase alpha chain
MTLIANNTYTQDQLNIFMDRYALRDETGQQVESAPEEMFSRVAKAYADNVNEELDFYDILDGFKFVPGGRILASGGTGTEAVAYNCFVIPLEPDDAKRSVGRDSREAIIDTIGKMVNIMSRGGGVGINWSTLRPRNAHLAKINGTSSGPIGWMDVASSAVGEVIQGGSRRGAAMFMLNDWHPDILEFTNVKRERGKVTNANISVAISDDFMEAVKRDLEWALRFPDTSHPAYNDEWDGDIEEWEARYPVIIYETVRARDVWRAICEGAWDNGEPGVVFLDRYNKQSTGTTVEKIICVNPCGEQGLGAYSVCNLGSMNLVQYVDDDIFQFGEFRQDVHTAVRFLDNVIDKTHYMEDMPQTYEQQMKLRRIGLGVMGLADVLAILGIRYGSPEAIDLTERIFSAMKIAALTASNDVAQQKGPALAWNRLITHEAPYLQNIPQDLQDSIYEYGLRNIFLLTQAPTGTTSLLAGVNSGIEPFFALEYERNDRMGKRMVRPRPYQEWLEQDENAEWVQTIGSAAVLMPGRFTKIPDYFVTANDLSVEEHIAMQAAAQKYIDSSISKTVNAPNSHTVEDVDKLYMLCYDSGLKGISYFREGCNRDVVLSRKTEEKNETVPVGSTVAASPYSRPVTVFGTTQRMHTKHGHAFVTVNFAEDNGPIEVFVNVGRANSDISEWGEGMGRLVSLALRYGIPREVVAEQLTGVGGYSKMAPSLSTAVAEAIKAASMGVVPEHINQVAEPIPSLVTQIMPEVCTQCGNAAFVREEGCMKCQICGNSKC